MHRSNYVGDADSDDQCLGTYHVFTPETEATTYYFWAVSRKYRAQDEELTKSMRDGIQEIFECEDKPMIAAQHDPMAYDGPEQIMDNCPAATALALPDTGATHSHRKGGRQFAHPHVQGSWSLFRFHTSKRWPDSKGRAPRRYPCGRPRPTNRH